MEVRLVELAGAARADPAVERERALAVVLSAHPRLLLHFADHGVDVVAAPGDRRCRLGLKLRVAIAID